MTEMEMLKELGNVVAGQAGGNREKVKAGIRRELVDAVKE